MLHISNFYFFWWISCFLFLFFFGLGKNRLEWKSNLEADPKWTQNFQCASASDSEKIMAHRSALFSRCFRTSFLCLLHVVLAAQATLPATSFDDGVLTEFVAKVRFAKCASHLSSLATAARKHGENASTTKMAALYDMRSPGTRLSLTAYDLGVLPWVPMCGCLSLIRRLFTLCVLRSDLLILPWIL